MDKQTMKQITKLPSLPPRPKDGHKGVFGTVIVIGGCETMIGAPALSAGAALRSGAGLVKIASDLRLLHHILVVEPSATGIAFGGDIERKLKALDDADSNGGAVLAIGPGIGQSASVREIVQRMIRDGRDVVLDADGLNALAGLGEAGVKDREQGEGAGLVMTPHPGEYARLADGLRIKWSGVDSDQRVQGAGELARRYRAVVVLKGHETVVSNGTQYYINKTGNVSMSTAGSGDVLTGVIASLRAQGVSLFDAAVLGVHLHGQAGDIWADKNGFAGLKAMDLVELLPLTMQLNKRERL
ncbi:ATP-dependent (S)-NAD(P)H-hydrate dehydratase [Poriferisphaera corsica]|uniref:ADP-dependent (S)-NAD(P)H-hydrate dehydratase n=1 Tax=Poriferisphaera corsica TaxID=2528020 RepID=A0A517YRC6_9BACT|nr:NAD(P)H-hydrate dehydratase [Poriferisphaera corsica]QDU32785.1 ATP-dependent (S)-NAD(P)H-hydrate dehydratase [Poriferisphaera corsica]